VDRVGRYRDRVVCMSGRVRGWKDDVFQDWGVNHGAGKSQLVMALFRQAARWHRGPARPWQPLLIAAYTVLVNWVLGVEIPPGTEVGPQLRLFHPQTIVINADTRIGGGCTIRASTILGNIKRQDGTVSGSPWIRDRVELGAGVIVIGPVEVGPDVRIGAGAVVTKSIPANAVAVGNPARVISENLDACS
jgi:putative colanic acid biosynthesis acetyltransferase WcaB